MLFLFVFLSLPSRWHLVWVIGLDSKSLKKILSGPCLETAKWKSYLFCNQWCRTLVLGGQQILYAQFQCSSGKEWARKRTKKKWIAKTKDLRAEKWPFIYAIFLWFCHVGLHLVFHYHKYNADLVKWQRLKVLVSISFSNPLFVNRVAFWRGSWTVFMRFRFALQRPCVHLSRVCDHSYTSLWRVAKPTLTPLSFVWSSSEFTVTFMFSGCIEDVTEDGWNNLVLFEETKIVD